MPAKKRTRVSKKVSDPVSEVTSTDKTSDSQTQLEAELPTETKPESVLVAAEEIEVGDNGQVKRVFFTKQSIMFISAFVVVALALVSSGYFFLQYQNAQQLIKDPGFATSKEVANIVSKIGKLIELPTGEEPTVATVSDIAKLQGQEFFTKAQNGDKVLIFAQAKKAYLYRPSTNKLIDVAPVSFPTLSPEVAGVNTASGPQSSPSGTITPSPSETPSEVTVALYNGSGVTGVTRVAEAKLTSAMKEVTVSAKENANNRNYSDTIVVDLTQKQSDSIEKLIETLGVGKKGALPTDETKPDGADILIILGTDFK